MDLGLAMTAGNAFFREQNAQDIRDREKQRFDWEQKRANAEMSLLDAKTSADRSGYELRAGQNQQGVELLPGDTANKKTEQGIKTERLAGEAGRVSAEEAKKDADAQLGLAKSASDLMMQPEKLEQERNVQKIATAISNLDVDELPRTLAQKKLANEVSASDADVLIAAKLSDLIDAGDTNNIVRLLNAQKRTLQDPKIQGLPDVASVSKAKDANGMEFLVLKDAQGNQIMARPIEAYRAAKNALSKINYEKIDAGDSLVRVQGGKVTPVFTAPESEKSRNASAGPLARDINYYMKEFGLTKEQAEQKVNSTKSMSREQFVLKAVQENTMYGKDPDPKVAEKWGKFYDDVMGNRTTSNSPANPKMGKPEVRSVLGLD